MTLDPSSCNRKWAQAIRRGALACVIKAPYSVHFACSERYTCIDSLSTANCRTVFATLVVGLVLTAVRTVSVNTLIAIHRPLSASCGLKATWHQNNGQIAAKFPAKASKNGVRFRCPKQVKDHSDQYRRGNRIDTSRPTGLTDSFAVQVRQSTYLLYLLSRRIF